MDMYRYKIISFSVNKLSVQFNGEEDFSEAYVERAKQLFGKSVMEPQDLDEGWQGRVEELRQSLLEPFQGYVGDEYIGLIDEMTQVSYGGFMPKYFIAEMTKACNATCIHCSGNYSSRLNGRMSADIYKNIFSHFPGVNKFFATMQIIGGEPLLLGEKELAYHYKQSIFKNTVIVTNLLTIRTKEHAKQFAQGLLDAHKNRPIYKDGLALYIPENGTKHSLKKIQKELSINISIDEFHPDNVLQATHLITAIFEYSDEIELRLKTTKGFEGTRFSQLIKALQNLGYDVKTEHKDLELIAICVSYKEKLVKINCTSHNLARIGRAIFLEDQCFQDITMEHLEAYYKQNRSTVYIRYNGAVEITKSGPGHSYTIGNLKDKDWVDIVFNARHDPLFIQLTEHALNVSLPYFMNEYDQMLHSKVMANSGTCDAYEYWALISPIRKLYFTIRLLQEMQRQGNFPLKSQRIAPHYLSMDAKALKNYCITEVNKLFEEYDNKRINHFDSSALDFDLLALGPVKLNQQIVVIENQLRSGAKASDRLMEQIKEIAELNAESKLVIDGQVWWFAIYATRRILAKEVFPR